MGNQVTSMEMESRQRWSYGNSRMYCIGCRVCRVSSQCKQNACQCVASRWSWSKNGSTSSSGNYNENCLQSGLWLGPQMQTLRYATKSTHTHTHVHIGKCVMDIPQLCVCVCVNSTDTRVPTVLAVDAVAIKRRILNWRFEGQTNTLSTHAHTQSHTTIHTHAHTYTWLRCNCAWKLSRTRIYARLQLWYKILAGLDQREKSQQNKCKLHSEWKRESKRRRQRKRQTDCVAYVPLHCMTHWPY